MAMTINTNVISINAQRNLGLSGNSMGTTMQRLSSGLRVNSAKDDAAGLAIAERMNSQARGLTVAARNANDGISLAQTAEGALGKVGDMLQRMRELAVQSSNATNSTSDREALQAEVNQLRAEIDRVAKTSSFNGKHLLDGSFAGGVFQVGAAAGDNITVGAITNAKASALSNVQYAKATLTVKAADLTDWDKPALTQTELDAAVTTAQQAKTAADNALAADTGNVTLQTDAANAATALNNATAAQTAGVLAIQIGGNTGEKFEIAGFPAANSAQERLGQVVAAVNAKTADTGITAFMTESDTAPGTFTIAFMSDAVSGSPAAARTDIAFVGGGAVTGSVDALLKDTANVAFAVPTTASDLKGIETLDISTQEGAWVALKKVDSAIDQINSARADLGALQTRFEKSIENIDIMNENISAARGRIVDADFASETANLSRAQILQQAGTAMVAQANQLPQQVLSLLQ